MKEIKGYIENQDTARFVALLTEKKNKLREEQIKIERMQRLLQNTIDITDYAIHVTCGHSRVEECEEEYLIVVKLPQKEDEKNAFLKLLIVSNDVSLLDLTVLFVKIFSKITNVI